MRIVLFSRVPRWYSFKNERLVSHLAAEGFDVAGIIVETVPTVKALDEWTRKLGWGVFARKLAGKLTGKKNNTGNLDAENSFELTQTEIDPDVFHFDSHNSPECIAQLEALDIDVIVLRGCGIIKKTVIDTAKIGVINPHYATLPDYRGMDVTEWTALHGDPIAVSVHSVNKGVDTGTVLRSEIISPDENDTVGSLRDKSASLAVKLLREALVDIRDGKTFPENQMNDGGRQFFKMHPRLKSLANRRLQKYSSSQIKRNTGNLEMRLND